MIDWLKKNRGWLITILVALILGVFIGLGIAIKIGGGIDLFGTGQSGSSAESVIRDNQEAGKAVEGAKDILNRALGRPGD